MGKALYPGLAELSEKQLRAIALHSDLIRTGQLGQDQIDSLIRTGACGPVTPTQTKSWGSACPPGYCPPENLPPALNRWFAGEREGCRELPYGFLLSAPGAGVVTLDEESRITICPTRLIALATVGLWQINRIVFGIRNEIVRGPAPVAAYGVQAFQSVPFAPDCLKAGSPFTIEAEKLDAGAGELNIIFMGPAIG